jgi:flagellar protein FlaG
MITDNLVSRTSLPVSQGESLAPQNRKSQRNQIKADMLLAQKTESIPLPGENDKLLLSTRGQSISQSQVSGNQNHAIEAPLAAAQAQSTKALGSGGIKRERPAESAKASQAEEKELKEIQDFIDSVQPDFQKNNHSLRFKTDEETGIQFFQIVNKQSGDVVKQFPPEEMIQLADNLHNLSGIIFNQDV